MKTRFLITGLLGLMTITAFAQKGEVSNAQDEYTKYLGTRGNKSMDKQATESLNNAKTSIDKAAVNEKTSTQPLTFALKASIYSSLALKDTVAASSTPLFTSAQEAIAKAKELDAKKENDKMIHDAEMNLAQYQLNKGVKEYGNKQYDLAYKSFDFYRTVLPDDTNAIYYTGIAAGNAKLWDAAISNYQKLLTTNYSAKQRTYQDLSGFYLFKGDTAGAIKVMDEALAKYPNDPVLNKRSIEISLQAGKKDDVLNKIEATIARDPKNKTLYYYAGVTYSQVADDVSKKAAKEKDPTALAALNKSKADYQAKAVEAYKKALEIDPDYYQANFSLGYILIAPALEAFNAANKLPVNKQKEYDAAMAQANTMMDAAKPYIQKAVDLNPKSVDALNNLKIYYLGKKDMVNANAIKKQIDALNGGGAAPAN